ncbi:MAG: hypothetical protein JRN54_09365 [Nitrososphaerota archaeon]|nr:hypothetical protein [Nitrososphaerota archaeon]
MPEFVEKKFRRSKSLHTKRYYENGIRRFRQYCEAKPTRRRRGGQTKLGALTIQQDPAFQAYEPGHSRLTVENARAGVREFLTALSIPITPTALTELITKTRQQHRIDDFSTDATLERYGAQPPSTHNTRARPVAEVFKRNRAPLMCKFAPVAKGRKTKLISPGILKAVFDRLPRRELQLLIDLQNHSPERIDVLATTPLTAWEHISPEYYAIHYDPAACKVAYDHIGLVPAALGDEILAYANHLGRTCLSFQVDKVDGMLFLILSCNGRVLLFMPSQAHSALVSATALPGYHIAEPSLWLSHPPNPAQTYR